MFATLTTRIDSLTSLRFFAAAMIVVHHLPGHFGIPGGIFEFLGLNQGVSFFFVLSGFILQHTYRSRISDTPYIKFVALRFMRIWPGHVAAILIVAVLGGAVTVGWWIDNVPAMTAWRVFSLTHAWSPDISVVFAINSPSWSISTELAFYLAFPLLSRLAQNNPYQTLCGAVSLTVVWLVAAATYVNFTGIDPLPLAALHPFSSGYQFVLGIVAYELVLRHSNGVAKGTTWEVIAIGVAISSMAAAMVLHAAFRETGRFVSLWIGATAGCGGFAFLIIVFSQQSGAVSRALTWRPLVFLGEISFAIYLVHGNLPYVLPHAVPGWGALTQAGQIAVYLAFVFVLSIFVFKMVEIPVISITKRALMGRRRADFTG